MAHFSCHGGANWSEPEKSGLFMANDEVLTIKDLFELHLAGERHAACPGPGRGPEGAAKAGKV